MDGELQQTSASFYVEGRLLLGPMDEARPCHFPWSRETVRFRLLVALIGGLELPPSEVPTQGRWQQSNTWGSVLGRFRTATTRVRGDSSFGGQRVEAW